MSRQTLLLGIWIFSSLIAAALSMEFTHATYLDGVWHPLGNDSFYHARRILDAVDSTRGFYQFDDMIHAPQGSWLTWPWAYDWFMAKFVQFWQFFSPTTDSMHIITHTAVYWIFVNAAILLGITVVLNLPTGLSALVLLGFALSPLTQNLHGVGLIDHHYIEYTFVLLTVLTGLAWFKKPDNTGRAIALGITLGIAPAFHTGLFILQAPVLLTLGLLWLQNKLPPNNTMLALAYSLTLGMLAALLPSEPFQQGMFQFSVLSWFHLYIAATSTLFIAGMSRFQFGLKPLLGFSVLAILLLIPIWEDTIGGAAFLSKEIMFLSSVSEATSPYDMMVGDEGFLKTVGYYSLFGLIAPLLIPLFAYLAWKERSGTYIFFAVMVTFGISLLLMQFRLNYFGSFALFIGWAFVLNEKVSFINRKPLISFLLGLIIMFGAFAPGSFDVLFMRYHLTWDNRYKDAIPLFARLKESCDEKPGLVLVDNNYGHILRFHAECSIIANNFLMTEQHIDKIREMWHYLKMSPEELLENKPDEMRYVFARLSNYMARLEDGKTGLTSEEYLKENNLRLIFELNTRNDLPDRYKLIAQLPLDQKRGFMRMRVFEILPEEEVDEPAEAP
jgi:asparagine N-glycosylation enzyme membrane subunit Stt3